MKSPAFQFYPNDFVGGKPGTMEPDETHVYVWLLCLDWNQNGFEFDEKILAKWCRISRKKFVAAWENVKECFEEHDGRWSNPRLAKERSKQELWRSKSSEGGKKSAAKRGKGGSTTVARVVEGSCNIPSPSPTPVTAKSKATTSDAGASGREARSARPSTTGPRKASWLEPSCTSWEAKFGAGSFPWGKAGKALKPLHDAGHSPDEIATRLAKYLAKSDAQFVSVHSFATKFGEYGPLVLTGPEVVDFWMSPEVERLSYVGYVA